MEISAEDLAQLLKGRVEGNGKVKVNNVSRIEEGRPGTLTFLANLKYTPYIYNTGADIVLVDNNFVKEKEVSPTLIWVDDAYAAFSQLLSYYDSMQKKHPEGREENVHVGENVALGKIGYLGSNAYIGNGSVIGDNCVIYPGVFIGENVTVGDGTVLYPGVRIMKDCVIGKECTIHCNVVIGGDGFGFVPKSGSNFDKVPQIGNVILEDLVEIGAGTTVDRATIGSTILRKGVKLDNLIQIAHNVEIGENTVIASQSGIAGSTKVGKDCMIGGKVGLIGHIKIGDRVKIAAGSGVANDVEDDAMLMGGPAINASEFKKSYFFFKSLPKLAMRISALEKHVKNIN